MASSTAKAVYCAPSMRASAASLETLRFPSAPSGRLCTPSLAAVCPEQELAESLIEKDQYTLCRAPADSSCFLHALRLGQATDLSIDDLREMLLCPAPGEAEEEHIETAVRKLHLHLIVVLQCNHQQPQSILFCALSCYGASSFKNARGKGFSPCSQDRDRLIKSKPQDLIKKKQGGSSFNLQLKLSCSQLSFLLTDRFWCVLDALPTASNKRFNCKTRSSNCK